ncbi:positive regulator of cadmium resistance [Lactobacillus selangorensis]|uniref:Positive regulator of cadmium resistance n=1 Tax=Lactobacillus selangorensis TaxID=81857 RepID=A0A0R2FXA6_9LACO|nr:metalloregulator ArsR/SmtB family transcription factor [Lactobacillus selangorensis]KRN29556.1 positive regulator of cadmium resistance [Lactobacillus selangorensis]KRN33914.1 positive regulator of cadmium resistance [Lactobacillus selangorensis]
MAQSDCCPETPALTARPLLDESDALSIAGLFKILANDTRLRILHSLALDPHLTVSKIAAQLNLKIPAVSNQLQRLVAQNIVVAKWHGNFVHYEIIDACTTLLLERAWCLAEDTGRIPAKDEASA